MAALAAVRSREPDWTALRPQETNTATSPRSDDGERIEKFAAAGFSPCARGRMTAPDDGPHRLPSGAAAPGSIGLGCVTRGHWLLQQLQCDPDFLFGLGQR